MSGQMWTVGHWTCPETVFLETLGGAGIEQVVDVRAQPGSRRSPQFNEDALPGWLGAAGIEYLRVPELSGRRRKQEGIDPVINAGWQNQSFKNYADYTLTAGFQTGLDHLTALAAQRRVALMCGEPMPWRCHRLLIANSLTARGWTVWHLTSGAAPRRHELGQWGATPSVDADGVLTYPVETG